MNGMKNYQTYSENDLKLLKVTAKVHSQTNLIKNVYQHQTLFSNCQNIGIKSENQNKMVKSHSLGNFSRIKFIYHQPKSYGLFSSDKYTQTDKIQQKDRSNQKRTFMNVISKNFISKDTLKFVYGKQSQQPINDPHVITIRPSSFSLKKQQQTLNEETKNLRKIYNRSPVQRLNSLMSPVESFEHFPASKIKRSRNSSMKSSQSDLQFSGNCKNQTIQQQKLKQQAQNENKTLQNDKMKQTVQPQKSEIKDNSFLSEKDSLQGYINTSEKLKVSKDVQKQDWNNTIKFNQISLKTANMGKIADTNDSSAFTKTITDENNTVSPNQPKYFNNTKKISEFILCDQQINNEQNPFQNDNLSKNFTSLNENIQQNSQNICQDLNKIKDNHHNKKFQNNYLFEQFQIPNQSYKQKNVPVFQIKLSDLCHQHQQKDNKIICNSDQNQQSLKDQEKILQNIETSQTLGGLKQHQNSLTDKLLIYDRLQSSIERLGKNIGDLSGKIIKYNQLNKKQHQTEAIKQKENKLKFISNCYSEQVSQLIDSKLISKVQQFVQTEIIKKQQESKQIIEQVQKNQNIQLKGEINTQGQSQNQFLNLSYSKHFLNDEHPNRIVQTNDLSQINKLCENKIEGSLQIIDHAHQNSAMINSSLQNIYQNSKPKDIIENQSNHNLNKTPISHQSPQNLLNSINIHNITLQNKKFQQSFESIPQEKQRKNPLQNSYNKGQRQRRIKQFYSVKTFEKPRCKSQIEQIYKRGCTPIIEQKWSKSNHNKTIQQQPWHFSSKGLNYEMHNIYRDRSYSKKYAILGQNYKKQNIIELPFMERPVEIKLGGQPTFVPKYIKSKVYYVKN